VRRLNFHAFTRIGPAARKRAAGPGLDHWSWADDGRCPPRPLRRRLGQGLWL